MQVLERQQDGLQGREGEKHVGQGRERLFPFVLGRAVVEREPSRGRQRQQPGEARHDARQIEVGEIETALEAVEALRRAVPFREPEAAADQFDDRMKRAAGGARGAVAVEPGVGRGRQAIAKSADEPRLADPGVAGDENQLPLAAGGAGPTREQVIDLLPPSDQWGQSRHVEAVADTGDAIDAVHVNRLVDALERMTPEIGRDEESGDVRQGLVACDDRTRGGDRLEAGGDVQRGAERGPFAPRPTADFRDDDGAGVDADAGTRPRTESGRGDALQARLDVECRA